MPPRDSSRDDHGPESRWASEAPREAGREVERRYRPPAFSEREHGGPDEAPASPGSAFAASRRMRSAGPAGPGSSYGGSGGRASGSQAYGDDAQARNAPDDAAMDHAEPAPEIDRRRAGSTWQRPAAERGPRDSERKRAWPDAGGRPASPAREAQRPDDTQFDADYRQWRDEQMRLLDQDYAQWRKERYRKFAEEFSQWRSQRLKASPVGRSFPDEAPSSLGDLSPLGTPAGPPLRAEERPHEPERERSGGGLLGSLLGSHSERHKPQP